MWDVRYEPHPWLAWAHPIVRPLFVRDFRRASSNLVTYSERMWSETSLRTSHRP